MYLWICYFAPVISQRYIKNTLVYRSKLLAYIFLTISFRCSSKADIFGSFLNAAIATWNIMNEVYNGGFVPDFNASTSKETMTPVWDHVFKTLMILPKLYDWRTRTAHARFAELIQFWQHLWCRRPKTFWRKNLMFHWRKISYFVFIYIFPLVLNFIS